MNQHDTARKLSESVAMGHDVENALQLAYAAGFDQGREIARYGKPVIQIALYGGPIEIHDSVRAASIATGIDASSISRVCLGQRNKAGGYKWKYV